MQALAICVLLGGGWLTYRRGVSVDHELREHLLSQAVALARTLNAEHVKALSFDISDKQSPVFQQIRREMVAYGQVTGLRSVYSQALRQGQIVFGPENLSEQSPLASPPGTVYHQPTEANRAVFQSGQAFTQGPVKDEYGSFISAFAPVKDPRTDQVLMVVGLDQDAGAWNDLLWRYRLAPGLFTALLALVLLGGGQLLEHRRTLASEHQGWLRHTESILIAVCGVLVSVALAWLAYERESRARRDIFLQVAEALVTVVRETQRDLRESMLLGLVHFLESSEVVSSQEFHRYVAPIADRARVRACAWVPRVLAVNRLAFEAQARANGLTNFSIFERDSLGRRLPAGSRSVYYPVLLAEPTAGNELVVGFDIGSDPAREKVLTQAQETGMSTATAPIHLLHADQAQGFLIFHPVFSPSQPPQGDSSDAKPTPIGFAQIVVDSSDFLRQALANSPASAQIAQVSEFCLLPGEPPCWLAGWPQSNPDRFPIRAEFGQQVEGLALVRPIFSFGQAYALVVSPGPAFLAAYPVRDTWAAGLIGLLLTCVATLLAGLSRNRQARLEQEVRQRTETLGESEALQRTLLENISVGVVIVDAQSHIIESINPAAAALFGGGADQIVGRRCHQFICPSPVGACPIVDLGRALDNAERPLLKLDGTSVPVLKSAKLIRIQGRNKLLESLVDISDQKRVEQTAQARQAKLNSILRAAPVGIGVVR